MTFRKTLLSLSLAGALAACSMMPAGTAGPARFTDGVLTGPNGMTLYTFDRDSGGRSVCNGPCAGNWPPFLAADGASASGDYSLITRDDGKKQWAFKGRPLYFWSKDQQPGDRRGDGFLNNSWHVVKP